MAAQTIAAASKDKNAGRKAAQRSASPTHAEMAAANSAILKAVRPVHWTAVAVRVSCVKARERWLIAWGNAAMVHVHPMNHAPPVPTIAAVKHTMNASA